MDNTRSRTLCFSGGRSKSATQTWISLSSSVHVVGGKGQSLVTLKTVSASGTEGQSEVLRLGAGGDTLCATRAVPGGVRLVIWRNRPIGGGRLEGSGCS